MRKTTCPFDCWDACGALAEVGGRGAVPLDGDVTLHREVTLRGDPEHPFSRGTICGKLARYPAFLR
ncbi:MAG: hypothetical protein H5U04_07905, partial [Firmicutes bacterium]|nr:hypothetical protein [Bacillota bacterium]